MSLQTEKIQHQLEIEELQQESKQLYGFGYRAERGDIRDITTDMLEKPQTFDNEERRLLAEVVSKKVNMKALDPSVVPPNYSFKQKMTPVRNQGALGACTDFMKSAMIEYYIKTLYGETVQTSPLYGYKKTRDMAREKGDVGATIRGTMKSLITYGWIPEKTYPYVISKFDDPIPDELKEMGYLNQGLTYARIDKPGQTVNDLLLELKKWVCKEIPIGFGFSVYSSIDQAKTTGNIPYPSTTEAQLGGHAITITGYDDNAVITNRNGNIITKGAFEFKNSWSDRWGTRGYGKLPYQYILSQLALDFWVLLSMEWLNWRDFA